MNPFYSIITINLNNADGLRKTIDSVLKQSFKNFEFIIIDGASVDASLAVIEQVAAKLSFCVSEKDKGIYDAMNKGISKANGKYVLFLNSGDYFYDSQVLQKVFDSCSESDIIYGDVMLMKKEEELRIKTYPHKLTNYYLLTDNVAHQSQFISLNLFKENGVYDLEYKVVADYEFFLRVYFKQKMSYQHLNLVVSAYNLDGFSASPKAVKIIKQERLQAQKKYMSFSLVVIYQMYGILLNTKLYQVPLVQSCVNGIRNLFFRLIKK